MCKVKAFYYYIMQIGMHIVLQSTIKKPSDLVKRTLLKAGTELMCSGMEIRFGPNKGIRRVTVENKG